MNAICSSAKLGKWPENPSSEALGVSAARLAVCLEGKIKEFVAAGDQNLGSIELAIEKESRELLRQATEKAAQEKADVVPPVCPLCHQPLSRLSAAHGWLLSAVSQMALCSRRGLGAGRDSRLLTAGAGDGGAVGQQDAGRRSQCGAGASDGSQNATSHAGSGGAPARRTSAALAQEVG